MNERGRNKVATDFRLDTVMLIFLSFSERVFSSSFCSIHRTRREKSGQSFRMDGASLVLCVLSFVYFQKARSRILLLLRCRCCCCCCCFSLSLLLSISEGFFFILSLSPPSARAVEARCVHACIFIEKKRYKKRLFSLALSLFLTSIEHSSSHNYSLSLVLSFSSK